MSLTDARTVRAIASQHGLGAELTEPATPLLLLQFGLKCIAARAARKVEPTWTRPCSCTSCGCGNTTTAEACARWDEAAACADACRALGDEG